MSSPATLNDIAHVNEILHCMFTFLDDFTILKQLSLVCKQWNHVVWNMIDFGFQDQWPLRRAVMYGQVNFVQRLLEHPKVDATIHNGWIVRIAAENNQLDILKLMVAKNSNINLSAQNSSPLLLAAMYGYKDIVEYLLQFEQVVLKLVRKDGFMPKSIADQLWQMNIIEKITNGTFALFGTVKPISYSRRRDQRDIIRSCECCCLILDKIFENPNFDPSANDNWGIKVACRYGHVELVDKLLADPRVNPTVNQNEAVKEAAQMKHRNVVSRMLQDLRVNPPVTKKEVFQGFDNFKNSSGRISKSVTEFFENIKKIFGGFQSC